MERKNYQGLANTSEAQGHGEGTDTQTERAGERYLRETVVVIRGIGGHEGTGLVGK